MKKFLLISLICCCCNKPNSQPNPVGPGYEKSPVSYPITGASITEASGIADSRLNSGYLWVQEDGGNPPILYVLGHDGVVYDSVRIEGAVNRDWEDMAVSAGPVAGEQYLYIADIGDNNEVYPDYSFYRFAEPSKDAGSVSAFDRIAFVYPDSAHDAEAFVVDEATRDIYVITKREDKAAVYKIAYPQNTAAVNAAVYVGQLNYTGVVSAAISPDGSELIVKTYTTLYHYSRDRNEPISATLMKTPVQLSYQLEVQGEAVTFTALNNGFFTFSEMALGIAPKLNFYKRK